MLHAVTLFLLANALTVEEDHTELGDLELSSLGMEAPKGSLLQEFANAWQEVQADGVAPGKLVGPGFIKDELVPRQAWQYSGSERDLYAIFLAKWKDERTQYRRLYGFVQSAYGNLLECAKRERALDFLLAIGRKMNEDADADYWTWRGVQKEGEAARSPYVEDPALELVIMIAREFKNRHKVEGGGEQRGSVSARVKRTGRSIAHRLKTGESLEGTWATTPPEDPRLLQPELPPEGLPVNRPKKEWKPRPREKFQEASNEFYKELFRQPE